MRRRLRLLAAALGGCGLLLGSALAAGDERLYTAAVMPALRVVTPEAAHGLALRAAALGLLPPARPDSPSLVRLRGREGEAGRGEGGCGTVSGRTGEVAEPCPSAEGPGGARGVAPGGRR